MQFQFIQKAAIRKTESGIFSKDDMIKNLQTQGMRCGD